MILSPNLSKCFQFPFDKWRTPSLCILLYAMYDKSYLKRFIKVLRLLIEIGICILLHLIYCSLNESSRDMKDPFLQSELYLKRQLKSCLYYICITEIELSLFLIYFRANTLLKLLTYIFESLCIRYFIFWCFFSIFRYYHHFYIIN